MRRSIASGWVVSLMSIAVLACGGRMEEVTGSVSPTITREQLIPRIQSAICASAGDCCTKAGLFRHPDCLEMVRDIWQPIVDHAIVIGAAFDAARAARCVEQTQFEWSLCEDLKKFTSTADDVCAEVFLAPSPHGIPGQPCEASMDCVQDEGPTVLCLKLVEGSDLRGTCMRNLSSDADGPCGGAWGEVIANCKAHYVCGADHVCHPRASLGEPCGNLAGDGCATGNVCDLRASQLCRRAIPVGEVSSNEYECESFAFTASRCRLSLDSPLERYCL